MPTPKPIVAVRCVRMFEAGKGPSWWPTLVNSAGQTLTPHKFTNRDNALIETDMLAGFLGIEPEPYEEDGQVIGPSMRLPIYDEVDDDVPGEETRT